MGLYLVSLISQKLSITVTIASEVGQGTVLQLKFPRANETYKIVSYLSNNR